MSLFQNSVLQKYLKGLESEKVDEAYNHFIAHFHDPVIQENIRNSKEEQYQGEFLIDLFVKVLGYVKNPHPDFNLTTELKNLKGAKKADGAILDGETALAVIELKGTNTVDLAKVESQAFGYKNNQPGCVYVITSNFEKLRFYIDNAVEYEEFNLFNMRRERFNVFYLCLAAGNLLKGLPKRIKDDSLMEEEHVTQKLYKDYALFRNEVFLSIQKNNPEYDKLTLFKKTQKLLDRFLFIFFAEDRLLLPPNSIRLIIDQWMTLRDDLDAYVPLYNRFKKYFGYMNTGKEGKMYDIFAYNGGLFEPDEILDNIKIDDEILYKHTLNLSHYDFESEVSVNILGHIFEHSLNEIEEIQAEIEGVQTDKSKSKRKKDGVFYTPKYITKYIVDNTVGRLCEEMKTELGIDESEYEKDRKGRKKDTLRALQKKLDDYRSWLLHLTICDPACGSGAFLNQALEFLIGEHRYIDELSAKLLGGSIIFSEVQNDILENNLYGVDINEESVEIAKLSLWLRTAKKGRKLTSLNNNIKCGNSLIDDPEVAGVKAFNWYQEFPGIFEPKVKEAFHVVLTTHNSRTSQRMMDLGIKKGPPTELNLEEEIALTGFIGDIIKEKGYHCLVYNICKDHVHMILVCEYEELTDIVKTIKGKSSYLYQSNGFKPIGKSLWSQKFFRADLDVWQLASLSDKPGYVYQESHLDNALVYIRNNREKHQLPSSKKLQKIIDSFLVDQDTAFNVEYKGGFDVVIGNPPYVRAELLGQYREYLEKNYSVFIPAGDLFSYFYEQSFRLLKEKVGIFSFISNTFDKTKAGVSLRKYLQENVQFEKYIDFTEVQIFQGATTYPIILSARNKEPIDIKFDYYKIPKSLKGEIIDINSIKKVEVRQNSLKENNWGFKSDLAVSLLDKLTAFDSIKEKYGKCYYGVKTALNDAFIIPKRYSVGQHIKPIYEGKEIKKWTCSESVQQLILFQSKWTKEQYGNDVTEDIAIEQLQKEYSDLFSHILPYEERAKKRYDKGDFYWELRNCAYYSMFEKPKVIFPNLQNSNKFCFDDTGSFINAPAVILPTDDKFLISILNSKLIWFFLTNICVVRSGGYIEVKPQYFEQIPVPEIEDSKQFERLTKIQIAMTSKLQQKNSKFLNRLKDNLGFKKVSKKMTSFYDYDFKTFLSEVNKGLKSLGMRSLGMKKFTLTEQDEWEEYFNQYKSEINQLQSEIKKTDREIDQLVYELYGLTEEEIRIVEEATS